jgi:hypothetical protein
MMLATDGHRLPSPYSEGAANPEPSRHARLSSGNENLGAFRTRAALQAMDAKFKNYPKEPVPINRQLGIPNLFSI